MDRLVRFLRGPRPSDERLRQQVHWGPFGIVLFGLMSGTEFAGARSVGAVALSVGTALVVLLLILDYVSTCREYVRRSRARRATGKGVALAPTRATVEDA